MHDAKVGRRLVLMAGTLLVGIACTREVTPTEDSRGGPMGAKVHTDMTQEGCELHPEICHPDDGGGDPPPRNPQVGHVEEVGTIDYSIRTVPGLIDPHPEAPGVFLALSDSACYTRVQQYPQQDSDHDGMTDLCEYTLARAFAPMLNDYEDHACFAGEPYWAAKYFDNDPFTNTGDFVRIAYMPSYYHDCGAFELNLGAHPGDSEFIQETVGYNYNTKHWELFNAFLSAHTCTDDGGNCGFKEQLAASQTFPTSGQLEHPGGRPATYPRIYISWHKHANYKSYSDCNTGGIAWGFAEYCFNADVGRFMVWRSHNIGNVRYPLVDCTPSQQVGADPDREECYWTGTKFGGWNDAAEDDKAPGYIYLLHSFAYACKWLGPGHWICSSYGL